MAAKTLAQLKTRIARRFGSRTDLATQITDALEDAQHTFEHSGFVHSCWFLAEDDPALSGTANQRTLALPTGFLAENEQYDFCLFVQNADGKWIGLVRDTLTALNNDIGDVETAEYPTHYALTDTGYDLYPKPTLANTYRSLYMKEDSVLAADGDSNLWSTHAYQLLTAAAGLQVASELMNADKINEFAALTQTHRTALRNFAITRRESGGTMNMGSE